MFHACSMKRDRVPDLLIAPYSHCFGSLIHLRILNTIIPLMIPKHRHIYPLQTHLPNSRFSHLISYLAADLDILKDNIRGYLGSSVFPLFPLMATPSLRVFRSKNVGVSLHFYPYLTFLFSFALIQSQEILSIFPSKYVQTVSFSHYFHCTFLGLSHLSPPLD